MHVKTLHIIKPIPAVLLLLAFSVVRLAAQSLVTPFPPSFKNTLSNELQEGASLQPVFKELKLGHAVKVMQIGDSHVRGKYFPNSLESTLREYFPNIQFSFYGINGAWARRFYEQDMVSRVAAEHPDLVVISFGTNEAHGSTLDERAHTETMRLLTQRIRERCPDVCFLFTTPPGSFLSQRVSRTSGNRSRRRYSTVKVPNANTAAVARNIVHFCQENSMAVWDIYAIGGGEKSACENWRNSGLMNSDCVHFLTSGYVLQGKLLGEAIHKAYTETVMSGSQTRMMHEPTPLEQQPYQSFRGF